MKQTKLYELTKGDKFIVVFEDEQGVINQIFIDK